MEKNIEQILSEIKNKLAELEAALEAESAARAAAEAAAAGEAAPKKKSSIDVVMIGTAGGGAVEIYSSREEAEKRASKDWFNDIMMETLAGAFSPDCDSNWRMVPSIDAAESTWLKMRRFT